MQRGIRLINIILGIIAKDSIASATLEEALQGWCPVESSQIARIRYTTRMEVEFNNGSVYAYQGVPVELFMELLEAESVGRFFNQNIRSAHAYKIIEPKWVTVG